MTQPIQSDRLAPPIADRDRSKAARAPATPAGAAETASAPAPDTADVGQASALLRNAAPAAASGAVGSAEQARALAARVREAMNGDPARAVQTYASIHREDVQALLVATA